MAIVSVKRIRGSRSGSKTKKTKVRSDVYRVITDNVDEPLENIELSGVPLIGDTYPYDFSLTAKDISTALEGEDSELVWLVTVKYDKEPEDQEDEDEEGSTPLDEPADIQFGSTERDVTVTKDKDGKAIQTSAGEPIRGVTTEQADFAITITKNVQSISLTTIAAIHKQVSGSTFFGAAVGTARLSRVSGQRLYHQDINYYFRMTYEFQIREGGWDKSLLDEGYFELDSNGDQQHITITDEDGQKIPVAEPYLLDGNGSKLPQGDEAVFLDFTLKDQGNLADLNIPTSFSEA